MTNEIITFNFKNNSVRTQAIDGEAWFCLSDCSAALGVRQTRTDRLNDKGVTICHTLTNGGKQSVTFINEPNLYRLIFRSNKPQAQAFADWVYEEVLPSIRRTGTYSVADKPVTVSEHQRALPSGKKEIVLSEKAKQEIGGIVKAVIQANDRPAEAVQDNGIMKAINLLSARIDNMARFMSAGNTSAAQRECINLAERAAQRASDETGRAYSIPMNKEEYDLICFVRRGAYRNAALLPI